MEECLITSITRKALLATLRKEPRFSDLFVAYLAITVVSLSSL
jgi:hypothetical protein